MQVGQQHMQQPDHERARIVLRMIDSRQRGAASSRKVHVHAHLVQLPSRCAACASTFG
jgi:hypothetical protein